MDDKKEQEFINNSVRGGRVYNHYDDMCERGKYMFINRHLIKIVMESSRKSIATTAR